MYPNTTTILSSATMTMRGLATLLLSLLLLSGGSAGAFEKGSQESDSLRTTVYFPTGYAVIVPDYRGNEAALQEFYSAVRNLQKDSTATLKSIHIISSSSPTGKTSNNEALSLKRGETLRSILSEELSLPSSMFSLEHRGEDWDALLRLVEEAGDFKWKEEVSDIIRNTPIWVIRDGKIVSSRKKQLMDLAGGRAWNSLREEIFLLMQSSSAIECEVERMTPPPAVEVLPPAPKEPEIMDEEPAAPEVKEPETPKAEESAAEAIDPLMMVEKERRPLYMSLKTNLLYDLALTPNIGAEFYVKNGWSIGGWWQYAWWKNDNTHYYHRTYGGELDVRKYFGARAEQKPLTGHHLGLYLQGATYDFEFGGTGNLSKFSYGAGFEYGCSLPVAKRLNIDFGVGVGYFGGRYEKYEPEDGHYVWKQTLQRNFFGPTKAEISLVWLLGHGNTNKKGGAAR